jgi:hypothetical protein
MKQHEPPALANWMVRHLVLGNQNEALEGDLLEEFQRRRSVAWYWRQVLGAILASFSSELRADWVMVWTILFSTGWVFCLYAIPIVAQPVPMTVLSRLDHYLVAHGYYGTFIWYFSLRMFQYAMPFLFQVVAPLSLYLAGIRRLGLRWFTRGLLLAAAITLGVQLIPFQPLLDYLSMHGLAMYWTQLWKWYEVAVRIVPLLAAMWAAQSARKVTQPGVVAS